MDEIDRIGTRGDGGPFRAPDASAADLVWSFRRLAMLLALEVGSAGLSVPALAEAAKPGSPPQEQAQGVSPTRGSGLQLTPDKKRTLINKDVGAERWAITRNEDDGTVTGNVFFSDGRDPAFIFCTEEGETDDELMLSCSSANRCDEAPCEEEAWTFLADVTLPLSFFAPPTPEPVPTTPLGVRRFSINPATSFFRTYTGVAAPTEITGFEGFLELEAGTPDPSNGVAVVNIVGSSPVIAIEGIIPGVGPTAVCIVPTPGQLPITNAGVIDCDGGLDLGYDLVVDHNIGVVGVDGFTAGDCTAAGGTVEGGSLPHPGVCNGNFVITQLGEDSGRGALLIAPDLIGPGNGFNVRFTTETALPCGDEGVPAFERALVLASARTQTTVRDDRDMPGVTLTNGGTTGENFSCARWSEENGPGAVTFTGYALDFELASLPGFPFDAVSVYYLDD